MNNTVNTIILITLYIFMCVYLPNIPINLGFDRKYILKRSLAGWNSDTSFS